MSESSETSDSGLKVVRKLPIQYGRYRLEKRLGAGGMAEVFLASLELSGGFRKKIVVKRMLPHLAEQERHRSMFLREAKLASRLSHPNVVQLFELGEVEGDYFLAMEYVDGMTVRSAANRNWKLARPFPVDMACKIVSDAAMGLDYCHRQVDDEGKPLGLVHRDISPENLMISKEGVTKVLDFGIAKGDESEKLTRTGAIKGKVPYMAPEQVAGLPLDGRSDLWALGVSLYWLLTGRRPFDREAELLTLNAILKEPPRPPREHRKDLPADLERVVLTLLSKERGDRFQTGAELHDALAPFVPTSALAPSRFVDELGGVDERGSGRFYLGEFDDTGSKHEEPTRPVGEPRPVTFSDDDRSSPDTIPQSMLLSETRTQTADMTGLSEDGARPMATVTADEGPALTAGVAPTAELVREAGVGPRRWPSVLAAVTVLGAAAAFVATRAPPEGDAPATTTPTALADTAPTEGPSDTTSRPAPADDAAPPKAADAQAEKGPPLDTSKPRARNPGRRRARRRPAPRPADKAPAPPAKPAMRTVKLDAPSYILWLTPSGKRLGTGSRSVEVPADLDSVMAKDPKRGMSTTVPIPENGTIRFADLAKGELKFRVLPAGEVLLGEERIGDLPLTQPLRLVAGTYRVRLRHKGQEKVIPITVRAGRAAVVKHKFD